jgi:glucose/arabinose dehydrogenase
MVLLAAIAAGSALLPSQLVAQRMGPAPADPNLPYRTVPAFPSLEIAQPVAMVTPPGETSRLFVVEKEGRIAVIPDLANPTREVFLDISDRVRNSGGEMGLLALAFHPDYAENRQFYVWYTSFEPGRGATGENRLARFTASPTNPNRADPATEQILIAQHDDAGNHNGGELQFGPDGYLYVAVGDEGRANDTLENSQRIDKDFFAGILRIDVDRRPGNVEPTPHPAMRPGTYLIPSDNPFVGATRFNNAPIDASKLRAEFWATGLRNVWRMAFDPETGQLWAGDVGQNAIEEINVITRGGNYGWNYREATIAGPRAAPAGFTHIEPIWDYPRQQGNSITGGIVYRGTRYPDLVGQYLFADYATSRVWALRPDGTRRVTSDRVREIARIPSVSSFAIDPATGDILVASLTTGLLRLTPR